VKILAKEQLDFDFSCNAEASLYHDIGQRGFFALLTRAQDVKKYMQQDCYRLESMPVVLDRLPVDRDSWISQAEFGQPNRRVVSLLRIGLLFADIDTYRVPALRGRSPDELVAALMPVCSDEGIPLPSLVVFSGQGLQAKWLLDGVLPRQALPRWNACQSYLVDKLSAVGADTSARDASRVLRLVRTVNTKSGEQVRVVHVTEEHGQPIRYGFEYLCECLLPVSRLQIADAKKARLEVIEGDRKTDGLRKFSGRKLAWDRLEDLRTLIRLRGGVPDGRRMVTLHWHLNFLLLSGATNSVQMWHEAATLAREIDSTWGYRSPELSTLYRKAKAMEAGETVEWNGRQYPPLYTPTNDTLISIFEITDDEQRQLKTIISPSIARERDAERKRQARRNAGSMSRDEYRDQIKKPAQDKQVQARLLRARGLTVRQIAQEMGVSIGAVSGYLKSP
jgi:hypothetical protein